MRKLLPITFLAFSTAAVAAPQQPSPPPRQSTPPAAQAAPQGSRESDFQRRIRGGLLAGGTAPVSKAESEGVGAGAKPHMHFDALARGLHRRSEAKVIPPGK